MYCGGISGYGAADIAARVLWINRYFCNPLRALLGSERIAPARQGVGLITLLHEAIHVKGVFNEAKTECYAYQLVDDFARDQFHVEVDYLPVLLSRAYRDSLALQRIPPYDGRRFCRPGGRWDLSPGDGRWP